MRVVVIGDVSWNGAYHLGDEAMTEVAISELKKRGAEVTLIAGDTEISSAFYEVDTVARFGYRTIPDRGPKSAHLEKITAGCRGDGELPEAVRETVEAVRSADAVVIAGGGNLNSSGVHHIYERLTLKRVAEQAGIPLFVSSQTVGPHLQPGDREMVIEILEYARVFGVREASTAELLEEIAEGVGTVVRTLDDAILLQPSDEPDAVRKRLELPGAYVVGSFTFHSWSTGLSREAYYRRLSEMLDQIVEECDLDVVLLPHMGALRDTEKVDQNGDVFGHDRIAYYSRTGRVRSVGMVSARDLLAVTAGAAFTVSTRYHPVVFGGAVGVPAIGIVTSYYSAVRMRGALANVGMENFAVPYEAWTPLLGSRLLQAMRDRRDDFVKHITAAGDRQRDYQSRWWDGIVAEIAGTGTALREDIEVPGVCLWADDRDADLLTVIRIAQEGLNLQRLSISFTEKDTKARIAALERETGALRGQLREAERKRDAELADIRHRLRPPGAALRDRVRLGVRRLRG